MCEIVLELISLHSRSRPEPRRWACPRAITLSETASEAANLLSKLQRAGSGFERWIIQNASLPSLKQFAVLPKIHLPPQHGLHAKRFPQINNGGETCSIAEPALGGDRGNSI
jgi:hypothetical protein